MKNKEIEMDQLGVAIEALERISRVADGAYSKGDSANHSMALGVAYAVAKGTLMKLRSAPVLLPPNENPRNH